MNLFNHVTLFDLLGLVLIFSFLPITVRWLHKERPRPRLMVTLCFLAVFAGAFLILKDRVTELALGEFSLKAELQRTSDKLVDLTEFTTTVVSAQSDDREAFDKLDLWADDKMHPFTSAAEAAWITIVDRYEVYFLHCRGQRSPFDDDVDGSKLSFGQLKLLFEQSPLYSKPAFLEYIWRRQDVPIESRMAFLVYVMKTTESLRVLACAIDYFDQKAKLEYKNILIQPRLDWWEENKHSIRQGLVGTP